LAKTVELTASTSSVLAGLAFGLATTKPIAPANVPSNVATVEAFTPTNFVLRAFAIIYSPYIFYLITS
jgi:glucose-6-phosphate isomerase